MTGLREKWRSPAGRGFIMLAVMSFAFGFAMNAQNNLLTNYLEEVLHLSGPQFGYLTAIREIPGLLLIAVTVLLYRMSLQHVTAGALVLLALGLGLFGIADSFWSVVPWVVISSAGFHTVLQTQYALGMSLTTVGRSGRVLGQMAGVVQGGTLTALVIVFFLFRFELVSFGTMFAILGLIAFGGALAIFRFPHLHDGEERHGPAQRDRLVWRGEYRYFYLLNVLDGARQQIFFSFGLWVLVNRFSLTVAHISAILLAVTFGAMMSSPWVGRMIDRYGERAVLSLVNLGYVVALAAYAVADNVYLAVVGYVLFSFIMPISPVGAATYLRKIARPEEVAPSLAMGVTLLHATAVVVPVAAGFILNFVGYQVPFLIACLFAVMTFAVTRRLRPEEQDAARRDLKLAQESPTS